MHRCSLHGYPTYQPHFGLLVSLDRADTEQARSGQSRDRHSCRSKAHQRTMTGQTISHYNIIEQVGK